MLRNVRWPSETRRKTVKLPRLRPGMRKVVFVGKDVDFSEGDLFEIFGFDFGSSGGSLGPANLRALARSVEGIRRWDGVNARPPRRGPNDFASGVRSFRDPDLRISGRVRATIRVKKR